MAGSRTSLALVAAASLLLAANTAAAQSSAESSSSAAASGYGSSAEANSSAKASGGSASATSSAKAFSGLDKVTYPTPSAYIAQYGPAKLYTETEYDLHPYTVQHDVEYYPAYTEACPIAVEYKGCTECEYCGETDYKNWLFDWGWEEPKVYETDKCAIVEYTCEKVCQTHRVCDPKVKCDHYTVDHCVPHCEQVPYEHCPKDCHHHEDDDECHETCDEPHEECEECEDHHEEDCDDECDPCDSADVSALGRRLSTTDDVQDDVAEVEEAAQVEAPVESVPTAVDNAPEYTAPVDQTAPIDDSWDEEKDVSQQTVMTPDVPITPTCSHTCKVCTGIPVKDPTCVGGKKNCYTPEPKCTKCPPKAPKKTCECETRYREECSHSCGKIPQSRCSEYCDISYTGTCELLCEEKEKDPHHCYCPY